MKWVCMCILGFWQSLFLSLMKSQLNCRLFVDVKAPLVLINMQDPSDGPQGRSPQHLDAFDRCQNDWWPFRLTPAPIWALPTSLFPCKSSLLHVNPFHLPTIHHTHFSTHKHTSCQDMSAQPPRNAHFLKGHYGGPPHSPAQCHMSDSYMRTQPCMHTHTHACTHR